MQCMSRAPSAWLWKRAGSGSSSSCTSLGSVPTLNRDHHIFAAAAKANWPSGRHIPGAILVRPAVMFGPDDAFLTVILKLLQRLPAYPIFGSGMTKLQPAHVDDVAEAIARILQRTERDPITLECGGPHVYTYKDLVRSVAREAGLKPMLIPVPFAVWYALARAAEFLPSPPITRNQIELMQIDTVASPEMPGFRELGIVPQQLEETVRLILQRK